MVEVHGYRVRMLLRGHGSPAVVFMNVGFGGTVEIWDRGTYELLEDKPVGGMTVRLHGKRLEGTWALVPARLDGDERNWLLIRKRDTDGAAAAERGGPRWLRSTRCSPTRAGRTRRRRRSRRATRGASTPCSAATR